MRITHRLLLVLGVLCVPVQISPCAAEPATKPTDIPLLITQLGDPQSNTRDAAQTRLIELAGAALPELAAAQHSDDAEIRARVALILEQLRRRIQRHDDLWTVDYGGVSEARALRGNALAAGQPASQNIFYHAANTYPRIVSGGGPGSPPDTTSTIIAVNMVTGENPLWKRPIDQEAVSFLVADKTLVVTTLEGPLLALNALDGKPLWKFEPPITPLPENPGMGTPVATWTITPICRDGNALVFATATRLYALDLATGKPLWPPADLPEGPLGTPIVHDGTIWLASSDHLFRFDRATGKPLPMIAPDTPILSGPAALDDKILVGTVNGLVALDPKTHATLWTHKPSAWDVEPRGSIRAGPPTLTAAKANAPRALLGSTVPPTSYRGLTYYAARDQLFAIDPSNGRTRWTWQYTPLPPDPPIPATPTPPATRAALAHSATFSTPAFAGDRLFLEGPDGLFALNAQSGTILWEYHPPKGAIVSGPHPPPVVTADIVHFFPTLETRVGVFREGGGYLKTFYVPTYLALRISPSKPLPPLAP